MRNIYSTESLKPEHRVAKLHYAVKFNKCEHCGYDSTESEFGYCNTYYHQYGMILCDRCTDKSTDDWYWDDEDAVKAGFKPFPLPAPEVDEEKLEELRTMRGERRKERENR